MTSSSHLWHYTSPDNIVDILKNGLKLSISKEEHYDYLGKDKMQFMRVSFTDTMINDSCVYNKCFIGFNSKWVNNNNIYPVIYCRKDSSLTKILKEIISESDPFVAQKLCQYCKQHHEYTNEHEWVYIPESYSQDFLKFTNEDVCVVYVTSELEKNVLEKMFPEYNGKIKVFKNYKGNDIPKYVRDFSEI